MSMTIVIVIDIVYILPGYEKRIMQAGSQNEYSEGLINVKNGSIVSSIFNGCLHLPFVFFNKKRTVPKLNFETAHFLHIFLLFYIQVPSGCH